MPENEIEAIKLLFSELKTDMIDFKREIKMDIDKNFDELKHTIENYSSKTNAQEVLISKMQTELDSFEKRLVENFSQHKEFYENFKQMDRLIYKLIGGIIFAGATISVILKLLKLF